MTESAQLLDAFDARAQRRDQRRDFFKMAIGAAAAGATVGAQFTPELSSKLQASGKDAFGEKGEFHTLARVWKVPRELALGI